MISSGRERVSIDATIATGVCLSFHVRIYASPLEANQPWHSTRCTWPGDLAKLRRLIDVSRRRAKLSRPRVQDAGGVLSREFPLCPLETVWMKLLALEHPSLSLCLFAFSMTQKWRTFLKKKERKKRRKILILNRERIGSMSTGEFLASSSTGSARKFLAEKIWRAIDEEHACGSEWNKRAEFREWWTDMKI